MKLIILISLFSITACGVRGDLYLPEDRESDRTAEPVTSEQQVQDDKMKTANKTEY